MACAYASPPPADVDLPGRKLAASEHFTYFARSTDTSRCDEITEELEQHRRQD